MPTAGYANVGRRRSNFSLLAGYAYANANLVLLPTSLVVSHPTESFLNNKIPDLYKKIGNLSL
jgi:hypothetical protein